jgi:peptidoglycan-N-acetylglucosamine deacetylase
MTTPLRLLDDFSFRDDDSMPGTTGRSNWYRRNVLKAVAAGVAVGLDPARAFACAANGLGTSRTLALDTSGGLQIGLKTYPRTLALGEREVILTFDDGPVGGPTSKILDVLANECVKATFFLIGRNATANPGLARRIVSEGHTVAHHSFSHPWTFRQRSFEVGKADISQGFKAVDEAVYGVAFARPRVPFFRYPGFADTPELNQWLAGQGVGIFGCDLWASDWTPMSPEAQLSLVMARLRRAGRGIALFHDVQPQTAAMLPAFLRALKEGGWKVVHLVPGGSQPVLQQAGPNWRSDTERIIARLR